MIDERALYFHRSDAMTGDVEHVVDTSQDPEVAVVVPFRPGAREVGVRPLAPVNGAVAFIVSPDRPQHAGPRLRNGEVAAADLHFLPLAVEQDGLDAGEGNGRGTGLRRRDTGQRGDHDPACFRLPPRVHDGAAATADVLLIPDPRFRIYRFAHRADDA